MNFSQLRKDLIIIFGVAGALTLISIVLNLDPTLAKLTYAPQSTFAHIMKEYAPKPFIWVSVLGIAFISIPQLRSKFPLINQVTLVWLFAIIFGAGILVHNILKDGFERPRPNDSVVLGGEAPFIQPLNLNGKAPEEFRGVSFPSGHVASAAIIIAAFYPLRRRKPKLAKQVLTIGLTSAAVMGLGRMTAGAHYFTDVVWATASVALMAAIADSFIKEKTIFKTRYTLALLAVAVFCTAWFNDFKKTLTFEGESTATIFAAPCKEITVYRTQADAPYKASIHINGFGGPTKLLKLERTNGELNLNKGIGIYRDMSCTAEVWVPENMTHEFSRFKA